MRIALSAALLLFGASIAHGQAQTAASPVDARPPISAQALAPSAPVAAPTSSLSNESTTAEASARAELATAVGETQQDKPKGRSRVVWFLAGAVVVLAIIVAAS